MGTKDKFQPAFVLHTRPYRESSLLVDFFVANYGRVSVVARGAQKSKSTRSLFQPFLPVQITWLGKSDLKTLAKIEGSGLAIRLSGLQVYLGFYLNELLVRLLQYGDTQVDLFSTYIQCLRGLSEHPESQELFLRQFEINLLKSLGYDIDFNYCSTTRQAINPDERYFFTPLQGFQPVAGALSKNNIAESNIAESNVAESNMAESVIEGREIMALQNKNYSARSLKLLKHILRLQLQALLGDRPLNSRLLYQQMVSEQMPKR